MEQIQFQRNSDNNTVYVQCLQITVTWDGEALIVADEAI